MGEDIKRRFNISLLRKNTYQINALGLLSAFLNIMLEIKILICTYLTFISNISVIKSFDMLEDDKTGGNRELSVI